MRAQTATFPGLNRTLLVAGLLLSGVRARAADAAAPTGAASAPATSMGAFTVSDKPVSCFGISVKAQGDATFSHVVEMTILDVIPKSDADRQGLGPLTRILRIDGRDIAEFAPDFNVGSELGKKLLGRKKGDKIVLEVLLVGAKKPKTVKLVEGHGILYSPHDNGSDDAPLNAMHVGFGR